MATEVRILVDNTDRLIYLHRVETYWTSTENYTSATSNRHPSAAVHRNAVTFELIRVFDQ